MSENELGARVVHIVANESMFGLLVHVGSGAQVDEATARAIVGVPNTGTR